MNEVSKSDTNKYVNVITLVGRPPIKLALAVGKQKSLLLRTLVKEVEAKQAVNDEEGIYDALANCIAEFSDFKTGEEARESLTELEMMDLYLAIRGDIESTKRLFTLAGKQK